MSEVILWDLILIKEKREKKILLAAVSKDTAEEAKEDWGKIFNADVFFDPVPELVVRKHVPGESD